MPKVGDVVRLSYNPHIERKDFKDLQHWKIIGRQDDLFIIKGLETGTVMYEKETEIKKVFQHTREYMLKKTRQKLV